MASMATLTEPSVPFLKPIGKPEPDASSRCSWDSVVRAPMAPQVMRSAMNWGLIVSYTAPAADILASTALYQGAYSRHT